MAYLGYKTKAFREYKKEQERIKKEKELEEAREFYFGPADYDKQEES